MLHPPFCQPPEDLDGSESCGRMLPVERVCSSGQSRSLHTNFALKPHTKGDSKKVSLGRFSVSCARGAAAACGAPPEGEGAEAQAPHDEVRRGPEVGGGSGFVEKTDEN